MNAFGSTPSTSSAMSARMTEDTIIEPGIEPGASAETMLVTTDDPNFDEFEPEIGKLSIKENVSSTISDIQKRPVEPLKNPSEDFDKSETSEEPADMVLQFFFFFA